MTRSDLRRTLASLDLSNCPEELGYRQQMVTLLDSCPQCFRRDSFPAHFTGSAFVVSADGRRGLLHIIANWIVGCSLEGIAMARRMCWP